jgi:hypothetical protein
MWLPTKDNCTIFVRSLSVICLCGLVGILPDIDHVVAFFIGVPKEADHRIWHLPLLIGVGIVMLCLGAFSAGLYFGAVLKKK